MTLSHQSPHQETKESKDEELARDASASQVTSRLPELEQDPLHTEDPAKDVFASLVTLRLPVSEEASLIYDLICNEELAGDGFSSQVTSRLPVSEQTSLIHNEDPIEDGFSSQVTSRLPDSEQTPPLHNEPPLRDERLLRYKTMHKANKKLAKPFSWWLHHYRERLPQRTGNMSEDDRDTLHSFRAILAYSSAFDSYAIEEQDTWIMPVVRVTQKLVAVRAAIPQTLPSAKPMNTPIPETADEEQTTWVIPSLHTTIPKPIAVRPSIPKTPATARAVDTPVPEIAAVDTMRLVTEPAAPKAETSSPVALLRQLLQSSGIYAIASFVSPLISLVLAPFLTGHLSHADYGAFAVLTTAIALMVGITQFGLNNAFFRAYACDYE